ncbi:replication stress response regulator SDE2 isoform X1 [Ipomoea triloba]|uniref:replication stress response regulator SDE2 isoform X1 n=1 Tax=Ipomoea triloba TaxID=35885 RepID=UPI00125E1B66|nr:replication stress response regulator SDE2 isoform X1 [Ipomoea triloba]
MEAAGIHQVLVKLLDGKHRIINFSTPSVSIQTLKHRIQTLTLIPTHLQLLIPSDSPYLLQDNQTLNLTTGHHQSKFPVVVNLLLRLRGGKGGFGSLLRGAATKAGQKKTNNFDACRDMSGRRLRHVNAEKRLEEWKAEAEERKLEKMAEDYINKKAKELAKKGSGSRSKTGESADKYVAKYREDSAKCMEEVERSVRESLKGFVASKRKAAAAELNDSDSKKLKIWMGKRKFDDSDSEDMDEDDSDEDEENEKSVIIDNGNNSDSSRGTNGNVDLVAGQKIDSESGSEEEKDTVVENNPESNNIADGCTVSGEDKSVNELGSDQDQDIVHQNGNASPLDTSFASESGNFKAEKEASDSSGSAVAEEIIDQQTGYSPGEEGTSLIEASSDARPKAGAIQEGEGSVKVAGPERALNFDEISSAEELEALGMEKLKSELQVRGLKCGGTLQERAARLFLLKTTPLEMLPKKLLAKK